MALTETQRRYQNSEKGRESRRRYMEKRKAKLAAEKNVQEEVKTETPIIETPVEKTAEE